MLRNLNSFRSFQSRPFKNDRIINNNISAILKPKLSFYDLFVQKISSSRTNKQSFYLTNLLISMHTN